MSKAGKVVLLIVVLAAAVGAAVYFTIGRPLEGQVSGGKFVIVPYSPGNYFLTNVKDSDRMLMCDIMLEISCLSDPKDSTKARSDALDALKADNHRVRDCVIDVLRTLTEEDIQDEYAQEILRTTLTNALIERAEMDNLVNLYFNDFVMQ